jgi:hypothetical protein
MVVRLTVSQSSSLQPYGCCPILFLQGVVCPEEQIVDEYMVTTVFFDGQFWTALIEKHQDGKIALGKYVFGPEPENPRLLQWMLDEFSAVPLLPVEHLSPLRIKKRSLPQKDRHFSAAREAYKTAHTAELSAKKKAHRTTMRDSKKAAWNAKHEKCRSKKRH